MRTNGTTYEHMHGVSTERQDESNESVECVGVSINMKSLTVLPVLIPNVNPHESSKNWRITSNARVPLIELDLCLNCGLENVDSHFKWAWFHRVEAQGSFISNRYYGLEILQNISFWCGTLFGSRFICILHTHYTIHNLLLIRPSAHLRGTGFMYSYREFNEINIFNDSYIPFRHQIDSKFRFMR